MSTHKKKRVSTSNDKKVGDSIGTKSSIKSGIDSFVDNDNTYIIVVADERDSNLNENCDTIKNEMKFGCKEVELLVETTSSSNFMCRFCMSTDGNSSTKLMPLFNTSTKLKFISVNVLSALESLTGLKVHEDEDLPKYICNICLSRLEICWAFRQQCLKSDKAIRELQLATKQFCEMSNSASTSKINRETDIKSCRKNSKIKEEEIDNISLPSQNNLDGVENLSNKKSLKFRSLENSKSRNELIKGKRKAETPSRSPKSKGLKTKLESKVFESTESDGKIIISCEICNHEESSVEDLNKHLRTHYEEYPYLCDLCYKLFKTEGTLSVHVKTAHKINVSHHDRPIRCGVCHLEVPKNTLADHYLKHKTESVLKEHSPVLRHGPLLRCSYCWKTGDGTARRMTQYHCPDCEENLCLVPCFKEYHEQKNTKGKDFETTNLNQAEELDPASAITISNIEEPEK